MTKEEIEKKELKNKRMIGIIIVVLMVLSTAGYAFFSGGTGNLKKIKYNNVDFLLLEDGKWHFTILGKEFSTYHNPNEVKNIKILGNFSIEDYYNFPLYTHFENDKEIQDEILYNLYGIYSRANNFCFSDESCDWVEKNCQEDNLLIIKKSQNSLITKNDKCIYLYFNETEGLKVADAFIFKLLKIT